MKELNRTNYQTTIRPIKILQFGEGNFLRAFIDWFIQKLNDETNFNGNVAVIQPLSQGRIDAIAKQDGLYTLLLEGIQNQKLVRELKIIDVIQDYINPYTNYEQFLSYASSSDLQFIISNTTEAGIAYDENDIDDKCVSNSYPGKLLSFLKARYDHFNGSKDSGLFILPCELIDYNGNTLKTILEKLAIKRNYSANFIEWLLNDNYFYNTLVDRIVPGYPKDQIDNIQAETGYLDNNIVKGEIFHLWVIEGNPIIKKYLPIEDTSLNIIVSDNVKPYKERKVKILNGMHTCMVPVAYQCGIRTVRETLEAPTLNVWLTDFLNDEVLPTINLPKEEIKQFSADVIERFLNPTIHHELLTISLNSMTKYKTRVLPSLIESYEITKNIPRHCLFSLAALIALYRLKDENGNSLVKDDQCFIDLYAELYNGKHSNDDIVDTILNLQHWDYSFDDKCRNLVKQYFSDILEKGCKEALIENF